MNRKQLIEKFTLACEHTREDANGANHYTIKVKSGRFTFNGTYFQGSAHKNAPTLESVIYCLAMDATAYINSRSEDDFLDEYGYLDSTIEMLMKGRTAYKECGRVKRFFDRVGLSEDEMFLLANDEEE